MRTAQNLSRGTTYLVSKETAYLVQMQEILSRNPSSFSVFSHPKISHESVLKINAFNDGFE